MFILFVCEEVKRICEQEKDFKVAEVVKMTPTTSEVKPKAYMVEKETGSC